MSAGTPPPSDPRLPLLLETMRSFAEATSDSKRLVTVIAEGITRFLGDGCAVFLASDDRTMLNPAAVYNRDPEVMAYAQTAWLRPISVDGPGPTSTAFRTVRPVLLPDLTPAIRSAHFTPASAIGLDRARARSLLSVPLRAHDQVLGALALSRHRENDPPFTPDDEALAATLADHAALALANARLLESLQDELVQRLRAEVETQNFVSLVEHSSDFIGMATFAGEVRFVNQAGRQLLGIAPDADVTALQLSHFHTDVGLGRAAIIREKGRWEGEGVLRHLKTGELIPTQISSFVLRDAAGKISGVATVQRDLRERRRIDEQLRQVQKMEAVGRLASGVAHDFNNFLFIILNYAGALANELGAGSPLRTYAQEIQKTAERGAALTRQLLAFSRQQVLEPQVTDLNRILTDVEDMTRRVLGKSIALELDPAPNLRLVRVDVGQLEQVLLNLAMNARDAMPEGGRLSVASANVDVPAELTPTSELPAGPYVRLSVRDSGVGIDPAIRSRIFDPFFTTKPTGKGTGLGLSIVFGVVKQSGGHVAVSSEVGRGTTFDIYLPAVEPSASPTPRAE